MTKTKSNIIDNVAKYNKKTIRQEFKALPNSERGKALIKAKKDPEFVIKFWNWCKTQYN